MQSSIPSAGDPAPSASAFVEVLVVRAGEFLFAVDIEAAVEIRGPEAFDRLASEAGPRLTVRGQALPVVDLRLMSGLSGFGYGCPAMLLMATGADLIALAVDEVQEIHSVPGSLVQLGSRTPFAFCSHRIELSALGEIPLIDPTRLH
ncbi:chemotaxis protein CheW [Stenotrophomonas lactitubi]|uniref:chemotaxis protein CheW n=1 Tax=Stenotrophomonas lactitubi TaxID=2045214 RepID=UPI001DF7596C|nr:chemotaxis protein CheW [Stenotrophomonas lactitubi]CAH0239590.1 hypothetical protein SRABI35_02671 [Stenotrophomonas lactitubi]